MLYNIVKTFSLWKKTYAESRLPLQWDVPGSPCKLLFYIYNILQTEFYEKKKRCSDKKNFFLAENIQ